MTPEMELAGTEGWWWGSHVHFFGFRFQSWLEVCYKIKITIEDMTRRAPTTPSALWLAVALETGSLTIITPYR